MLSTQPAYFPDWFDLSEEEGTDPYGPIQETWGSTHVKGGTETLESSSAPHVHSNVAR